jgi:FkbM family methyltransferase
MSQPLIYDVGMHNGDDTGYYLQAGYRVLAIEANPQLVEHAKRRFAPMVATGRLTILGVGVAREEGLAEFWVSDKVSVFSSFDRALASRAGGRHHAVEVRVRPFRSIVAEFGTPHYCKIDIEGSDHLCLEGLTPASAPRFLSLEMSHDTGDRDLATLVNLGYRRFKIIDQRTFRPPSALIAAASGMAPALFRYFRAAHRRLSSLRRDGDWHFPEGSSGPFGERTSGPWLSYSRVLQTWLALQELDERLRPHDLSSWFDVHAAA